MFRQALIAAGLFAFPALAGAAPVETRIMAVGGAEVAEGHTEAFAGAALGADYKLSESTFVGAEASIERALRHADEEGGRTSGTVIGRAGVILAEETKLYALAGVHFAKEESPAVVGVGIEREFGKLLGSLEYRHIGNVGADQFGVGLGIAF